MGLDEAETYVRGLHLRQRDLYQCTRMLSNVVHHVLTGKDLNWEFPWDNESTTELTEDDIRDAQEEARAAERWMAAIKAKKNETEGK